MLGGQERLEGRPDVGRAAEPAADDHLEAEPSVPVALHDQADVVDPGGGAVS